MSNITFSDVAHQSISFSHEVEGEALVLELIDTRWMQRLRDISQTANTRLVYMFSEHSRFGHSLGVAYLACKLMQTLSRDWENEIAPYRSAVSAAALLHDIGHLAPGSHTAFKTWFPRRPDTHEEISARIITEDPEISGILRAIDPKMPELVTKILAEDPSLPPWTWEIISGGGWNVDRGNWCIVDSILGGVSYGQYNIPALIESIILTPDKHLALRENRLDAMMHFAVSRHAMYRQVYQHRVILSTDMLNRAIAQRARDIKARLNFCDTTMSRVLDAEDADKLPLDTIISMREAWWRYHTLQWRESTDGILADLSARLIDRRLLKTVRVQQHEPIEELQARAADAVHRAGYDSHYYLHTVSTSDMHESDHRQSMLVLMDDGRVRTLPEADPLFLSMVSESKQFQRSWLVLPEEAKQLLGRNR